MVNDGYLQSGLQENMINHGEHILTLDNYFDEKLIEQILEDFQKAEERGLTLNRNEYEDVDITQQKDSSIFYSQAPTTVIGGVQEMIDIVNKDIIDMFIQQYPVLQSGNYKELYVSNAKIQKTSLKVDHNWHSEHTNDLHSKETLLAWMVYLNDVEDGGRDRVSISVITSQTYSKSISALIVTGFTHLHREICALKTTNILLQVG